MSKPNKAVIYTRKSTEKEDCWESFRRKVVNALNEFEQCDRRERVRKANEVIRRMRMRASKKQT